MLPTVKSLPTSLSELAEELLIPDSFFDTVAVADRYQILHSSTLKKLQFRPPFWMLYTRWAAPPPANIECFFTHAQYVGVVGISNIATNSWNIEKQNRDVQPKSELYRAVDSFCYRLVSCAYPNLPLVLYSLLHHLLGNFKWPRDAVLYRLPKGRWVHSSVM